MKKQFLTFGLICSFLFLAAGSLSATVITWTGNGSNNLWSNSANWNTGTIPAANDDVIIPTNSGTVRFNYVNRRAKTLNIQSGSQVTILNGAQLRLINGVTDAITNAGTLFNRGTLVVDNATFRAIINTGTIDNRNTITMNNLGTYGIINSGALYNRSGATMIFNNATSKGITSISGTFSNDGTIRFLDGGSGTGLTAGGVFTNNSSGVIAFEGNNPGFFSIQNGMVSNSGRISFGAAASRLFCVYINTGNNFFNNPTGLIEMEGFTSAGIGVTDNCVFENQGELYIEGDGNVGTPETGISMSGTGYFSNIGSGSVEIVGTFNGIYIPPSGGMKNYANIQCSDANFGIATYGVVSNLSGGVIAISNSIGQAIRNEPGSYFENDEGSIDIDNSVGYDLYNRGTFINQECSYLVLNGTIRNENASFTNYGWITENASGSNHSYAGAQMINEGIVIDPYNRFATAMSNQKARIIALVNPQVNVPYPNALDIASTSYLAISDFHLNPGLNDFAGTYNLSTNTYTPNSNALGATTLYAKGVVGNNNCIEVFEIRVDGGVQPIGSGPRLNFATDRSTGKSSGADIQSFPFSLSPNPSNGFFTLQMPENLEGPVDIRLVDLYGRILWQQQQAAMTSLTLDMTGRVAKGTYHLQIQQNGQLITQQKLMLQ